MPGGFGGLRHAYQDLLPLCTRSSETFDRSLGRRGTVGPPTGPREARRGRPWGCNSTVSRVAKPGGRTADIRHTGKPKGMLERVLAEQRRALYLESMERPLSPEERGDRQYVRHRIIAEKGTQRARDTKRHLATSTAGSISQQRFMIAYPRRNRRATSTPSTARVSSRKIVRCLIIPRLTIHSIYAEALSSIMHHASL